MFTALAISVLSATMTAAPEPESVDFVADVRPILAAHCYRCHGAGEQQAGLRLDHRESALRGGDSGPAIITADAAASELVKRITAEDEDERMPPAYDDESRALAPEEIETIRRWVNAGAIWPDAAAGDGRIDSDHWAYQPLAGGSPPLVRHAERVRNPIDAFVVARLEAEGIEPSPEADRYTLIRRLYYDLLGLPPHPDEVDAFVADDSDDAYEQLVDRLLRSPHFGERWGRHWLDKARYADSDGYEKDRPRPDAWRYRDWVIDAFNRDLPFDQFTVEQLAGDLLPGATDDQRLATAFHRQTLTNTEGGTDQEEFRVAAVMDRVQTTGSVWLGLTVGCAQCHSHKYDQITQAEYYQLFAFYNNGDETTTNVPTSAAAMEDYERALAIHDVRAADLARQHEELTARLAPELAQWEGEAQARLAHAAQHPPEYHTLELTQITSSGGAEFTRLDDGSYLASGNNPDRDTLTILATTALEGVKALRIEALAHDSLPARGPGRVAHGNFVLSELAVYAAPGEEISDEHRLTIAAARADHAQDNWPVAAAFDGDEKTGWAVGPEYGVDHWAQFTLAQSVGGAEYGTLQLELVQNYGKQHTLGCLRIQAVTGEDPSAGMPEEIVSILAVEPAQRDDAQRQELLSYFVSVHPAGAKLEQQIADHAVAEPQPPVMNVRVIAQRTEDPRTTHILRRGDFLQPQDAVEPRVLSVLPSLTPRVSGGVPDRLDLARWLVDARNPLTPRVVVNQVWSHLFGRGIVPTSGDFGVRGQPPTHPKLLDWLAQHFIDLGWSRKELIRLIVSSNTYRQTTTHRAELAEIDPQNDLLYRQNRFRVEGEVVRDLFLAASGLLSLKVGGPSVYPPMPPDVAALSYANNFKWENSSGEDRYRRGIYTFFKRTSPYPNLVTFDCPDANTACVERRASNTPLQALTTLNNDVYVEAAQALAQRVLNEAPDDDRARLAYAMRLCVARPPQPEELEDASELLSVARDYYAAHAEEARTLTGIASTTTDDAIVVERAAWTATARVFLNLDEFVTRP
mgnify:FL=1